eukprot:scaffold2707_cov169-Amphora_coffeaeformis.AAC.6
MVTRVRQACCSGILVPQDVVENAKTFCLDLEGVDTSSDGGLDFTSQEGLKLLLRLCTALKHEGSEEGAVCFSEFEDCTVSILRKCKHVLCSDCLKAIMQNGIAKCPLCRVPFRHSDIVKKAAAEEASKRKTKEEDPECEKDPPTAKGTLGDMSPKSKAIFEEIKNLADDEKVVIFSQWTSHLDIVQGLLETNGHSTTAIQDFSSDDEGSPRFILYSLMAAGTGITLTRENVCFVLDTWWNAAIENQAMDRVHRLGQTRPVRIISFIVEDSLEQRMVRLQENKSALGNGSKRKRSAEERKKVVDIEQHWDGVYDDDGEDLGGFIVED